MIQAWASQARMATVASRRLQELGPPTISRGGFASQASIATTGSMEKSSPFRTRRGPCIAPCVFAQPTGTRAITGTNPQLKTATRPVIWRV